MCKAFEDMILSGEERGEKRERECMMKLIQCMTEDGVLESIPRIATEPAFYKEMLAKYHVTNEVMN